MPVAVNSEIAYTVVATIPDERTLTDYVSWLLGGHIQAVLRGGATSAEVIGPPQTNPGASAGMFRVETRYIFPTPQAFEAYEAVHAPALRAEGVTRFGGKPGMTFSRSVGGVLGRATSTKDASA